MRRTAHVLMLLGLIGQVTGCVPAATPVPYEVPPAIPIEAPITSAPIDLPISPAVDNLAPNFTLSDTGGNTYDLWGLRGSPVLLNFWATWCGPCLAEMPALQSIYNRYSSQGLYILAVNGDNESYEDIISYQNENGLGFPLLVDTDGAASGVYEIGAFPTSIFIDANGVIKYINAGSMDEAEFDQILNSTILLETSPVVQVSPSETISGSSTLQLQGEFWAFDITEPHLYDYSIISDKIFTNFVMQTDVLINSELHEYHGLLFRQQDNENFYTFRITPDGYYAFDVWQAGDTSFQTILGPNQFTSIRQGAGQVNTLKVIATNEVFDLYINDMYVGSISDSRFPSGKVGVLSCTCAGSESAAGSYLNFSLVEQP